MKRITVTKNKETERAYNLCVSFWVDSCDFWLFVWLPKSVVKFIDDKHAEVTDWALQQIIDKIATKHSFNKARYNARFYPENIIWNKEENEVDFR